MFNTIEVVNLKCGGCGNRIKNALEKEGFKEVKIDVSHKTISFRGDKKKALKTLTLLGYPPKGSREARSLSKKAKSYLSCMIGRVQR